MYIPNPEKMLTPQQWRELPNNAEIATPLCPNPNCNRHLGIRIGLWRDNGRDAWLCDKCGEFEAVEMNGE